MTTPDTRAAPGDGWDLPRLLWLGGLAALLLATYELARPTAESLFLTAYGSKALPWAWLGVAVGAALVSAAYARAVARYPLGVVVSGGASLSAALVVAVVLAKRQGIPGAPFAAYVIKDLYIVVLLEGLWAVANASWRHERARWLYGVFPLFGTAGSLVGSAAAKLLSARYGTENALLAVGPALVLFSALARQLDAPTRPHDAAPAPPLTVQLQRLAGSRYLQLLALTIGLVQLVVAFVDTAFNQRLEALGLTEDQRTAAIANVYAATAWGAAALQVLAGPLIAWLGVGRVLVGVPLVVTASLVALATSVSWPVAAVAKVLGKALDYSVFRAAKELVYLPLAYAEKTEGKGLVDVLAYRVAKGAASAILLALAALGAAGAAPWVAVGLGALWVISAARLAAAYRARSS